MIEIAQGKVGSRVRLLVADMRNLDQLGKFDVVWSVDDAMNYLLSAEELIAALNGFATNLASGGLLLFDLNTLLGLELLFCHEHIQEHGGRRMRWLGVTEPRAVKPGAIFEARYSVEGKESTRATHFQRHFPMPEVLAGLEKAGLQTVGVHGELDGVLSQPLDEHVHTKAVYLARLG